MCGRLNQEDCTSKNVKELNEIFHPSCFVAF